MPNHLISAVPSAYPEECRQFSKLLEGRSMLVKKAKTFPVECVARGYVIGSGWKDYQASGSICGIPLPKGLKQAEKLPEPIFTPSTKAELGAHDENISFSRVVDLVGEENARWLRDKTIEIYLFGSRWAEERGIIIADTKFEFGVADAERILVDEVMTPDSSRFWPMDQYRVGVSPPSLDKQFVRDYLETLDWTNSLQPLHCPRTLSPRPETSISRSIESSQAGIERFLRPMYVQTSTVGRRAGDLLSVVIRRPCVVRSEGDPSLHRHPVTCLKAHWYETGHREERSDEAISLGIGAPSIRTALCKPFREFTKHDLTLKIFR